MSHIGPQPDCGCCGDCNEPCKLFGSLAVGSDCIVFVSATKSVDCAPALLDGVTAVIEEINGGSTIIYNGPAADLPSDFIGLEGKSYKLTLSDADPSCSDHISTTDVITGCLDCPPGCRSVYENVIEVQGFPALVDFEYPLMTTSGAGVTVPPIARVHYTISGADSLNHVKVIAEQRFLDGGCWYGYTPSEVYYLGQVTQTGRWLFNNPPYPSCPDSGTSTLVYDVYGVVGSASVDASGIPVSLGPSSPASSFRLHFRVSSSSQAGLSDSVSGFCDYAVLPTTPSTRLIPTYAVHTSGIATPLPAVNAWYQPEWDGPCVGGNCPIFKCPSVYDWKKFGGSTITPFDVRVITSSGLPPFNGYYDPAWDSYSIPFNITPGPEARWTRF